MDDGNPLDEKISWMKKTSIWLALTFLLSTSSYDCIGRDSEFPVTLLLPLEIDSPIPGLG